MKKLFITFVMLLTLSVFASNAQKPWAVSAHGGYSWLTGVAGADFQYEYVELSAGWMPTTMPMSGDLVNSFCFAVTGNTLRPGDDGVGGYLTLASSSAGYRYEDSWGYAQTEPITIIGGGLRYNQGAFWGKVGVGYGWADVTSAWTGEVTIGFIIFGN